MPISYVSAQESRRRPPARRARDEKWGVPGPYPGRVIEVRNPGMIRNDVKNREAIKATVDRGMKELTGADDAVDGLAELLRAGRRRRDQDEPGGQPAGQLLERADARGHRGPEVGRGQDEGHGRLRALSRRVHRRQDARGRPRRHRLGRPGRRLQRPPDRHQGRGRPQDRQPRPRHRLRPRRVRGHGARRPRRGPQGRPDPAVAPGPAGHAAGQQDRAAAGAQGPRLGGRHRAPSRT